MFYENMMFMGYYFKKESKWVVVGGGQKFDHIECSSLFLLKMQYFSLNKKYLNF